jgi:Na+/H+ antiporter NhaD/arsenite permease-like protein
VSQAFWRLVGLGGAICWWCVGAATAVAHEPPTAPVHKTASARPVSTDAVADADVASTDEFPASDDHPENVKHHADDHQAAVNDHVDFDHGAAHGGHGPKLGTLLPKWSVAPFAILLGCIAVFPLVNPHWWEHNANKGIIVAVLALPTVAGLAWLGEAGLHGLEHALKEYVSFVILLGSLFVISGGVYVRGSLKGAPVLNTAFLAIGTAIASLVGTTGASMLLIRPLLRANQYRDKVAHIVVFFIFTVSNCGGLLTPLGDPPLFLGFLKGVPFEWTLKLWPQWLVVNGILLAVFFVWDTIEYAKEGPKIGEAALEARETFGIEGVHNFAFLAAIVAIIYSAGQNIGGFGAPGEPWPFGLQELLMAAVALAAYFTTSGQLREKNRFSFGPIIEVAVLFIGIFCTMIPALAILNVEGKNLGVTEPWHFFWAAGALSSFLDNAPTYVAFAVTAAGIHNIPDDGRFLQQLLALGDHAAELVAAIACGAVFMGANTYIGNGPNFMVKAIAEENNVRMPSFFGYMLYSVGILIPIFVVVTFAFFG